MRFQCLLIFCVAFYVRVSFAQDPYTRLKKAVEHSTLAQSGTKPFHLKATLTPSYPRTGDPDRTGEVELWWASPTHYRRQLSSATFHQVEIVDGEKVWQHNEGDYLPYWLHAIAEKLIEPVSPSELAHAKTAEVRRLAGTTYFQWANLSSDGTVQKGMGASIDLNDATGLLRLNSYGHENYHDFHGRTVATVVTDGSPEVKATVTLLEDLPSTSGGFLDASQPGSDLHPIHLVEVDELTVRRNLRPTAAPVWPALHDGPLDGVLTVNLVLDRTGRPRDCRNPISDNPGVNETARSYICGLQFSPILVNGEPVEVVSRFTMPFKTTRPAGMESFDSVRTYFEHGRKNGFPAAGSTSYLLRAEFQAKGASGAVETGRYEDIFVDDQHWRREVWFGQNHAVRSRNGEKRYRLEEGPQPGLTRLVFRITEPIPAIDTFVESDWRTNSTTENGEPAIRVFSGYESPEGKLDPQHSRAYWFTASNRLVKTYSNGFETRRSDFEEFAGVDVARTVAIYGDGHLAMKLTVNELSPSPTVSTKQFELKGHDWIRQFTDEVR